MHRNEIIFKNKELISELTKKYYDKTLYHTGQQIIESYPFDLVEFEDNAVLLAYFDGPCSIACSKEIMSILEAKFDLSDEEFVDSCDSKNIVKCFKSESGPYSIISILKKIYSLNLSEEVRVDAFYHGLQEVHLTINNNIITDIYFQEVPMLNEEEWAKEGYVNKEYHRRFLLHTIYKLSYYEPIIETLKVLKIA